MSRDVWSRAATERFLKQALGPYARVWNRDGRIDVGMEFQGRRVTLGSGSSYADVLERTFFGPARKRAASRSQVSQGIQEAGHTPVLDHGVDAAVDVNPAATDDSAKGE